ncbi:CDP-glucose 4,6-dehydratase [Ekhidna sp.]|uniref:CDP-glucose 4,6-dehydratase n=1 Tax=Ekhidna sp. TaxID=2608089 RepID=UPI0032ECF80D
MKKAEINLIQSTYRGKKVFLTGHTGFKGSWLSIWLEKLGAEVFGYSLAPENDYDLYNQLNFSDRHTSLFADIRDKKKFEKSILNFNPDFIFHLAAQPLVRYSYQHPVETYETNVIGTANLLNSMRKLTKKCAAIFITTDKVYHNNEWEYPYRENDRLGGYDPYSSSKACCELLIDSFSNSYFNNANFKEHNISISSARAGNVIGGGDWAADRIVPDIVRALKEGQTIEVRNPHSVRPWQHVIEPLGAYLLLGARSYNDHVGGAWNFGPNANDILTVGELVDHAISIWGEGDYTTPQKNDDPHEAGLLMLDISKSQRKLNWNPRYSSKQAIEMTINWYKNFKEGASANELIKNDIDNYLNIK